MTSSGSRLTALAHIAFAALAVSNICLVGGGAFWLATARGQGLETSYVDKVAREAEARSRDLARRVFEGAQDPANFAAQASRLSADHVGFALVGRIDGRDQVLASSAAASADQPLSADLAAALGGHPPDAETQLPSTAQPDARYTAYFVRSLSPVGQGALSPASPPPHRALRTIRRIERQQRDLPATSYTIQSGDTLYAISRQRYGDDGMFLDIWEANRAIIGEDRSQLPVGRVITLPAGKGPAVEVERTIAVYPSEAPMAPATATGQGTVALRLTLALPSRHATSAVAREQVLLFGACGALWTGLSWWLAAMLLGWLRRRQTEDGQDALIASVAESLAPKPAPFDPAAFRSPWHIEHAELLLAGEEPGGALTEFKPLSDIQLGLFIGDAAQSGLSAVVGRGLVGAFWRARAESGMAPRQTLLALNQLLASYLAKGETVSAFYAQLDLLSGAVTYASAGHTGAFILDRRGHLTALGSRSLPFGTPDLEFAARLDTGEWRLQEGESLLLFTSGLPRAENTRGEAFGLDRLERSLHERPGCDAETVMKTLREAVQAFVGESTLVDEAAVMCVRLTTASTAAGRLAESAS